MKSCTASLRATNLPALLHYEDRNSMAFSLESRVPFLDVHLVEYIASLPLSQKIRGGETKVVLRSAIRGMAPNQCAVAVTRWALSHPRNAG